MSIFRKKLRDKGKIRIQIEEAIATRAMVAQVRGMMPTMLLTFKTEEGETIELELQFETAYAFTERVLATYSAMSPQIRPINPHLGI